MNNYYIKTFALAICCLLYVCVHAQTTPEHIPGRVIVKMKTGKSSAQKKAVRIGIGDAVVKSKFKSKAAVWEFDENNGKDARQIVSELNNHPDVEYAELDYRIEFSLSPEEFCAEDVFPQENYFGDQWGLNNVGQYAGVENVDIDAPEAWDTISTSPSIKVAVIDTGIDWTHPDLIDNIWQNLGEDADGDGRVLEFINNRWVFDPDDENGIDDDENGYEDDFVGWDFADDDNDPSDDYAEVNGEGHGTHVAGIIGAKGDNGIGVSGVTWEVQMAALKIWGTQGSSCSDAVEAVDYAVAKGFQISNNSWDFACDDSPPYSLETAIDNARIAGHLFVAASANYTEDNDNLYFARYPASYELDNIISVTAINRLDGIAYFANYGANSVDIGAPGVRILSTSLGVNGYSELSGTSMAAPHVSGACALLWGLYHDKNYAEIKANILDTAVPTPALNGKCLTGGRLNLYNAITGFNTLPPSPMPSLCREADSLALLELKVALEAIGTGAWSSNWTTTKPINEWSGVGISENGCIESLQLYGSTLSILPPEIENLINLKFLRLGGTSLSTLPPEIGNLTNLESLILYSNPLTNLPPEIGGLINLKTLNLNSNQLTVLLPEIGNLVSLESLYLYNNQLTELPIEIGDLNNLKTLNLSSNQLASLPSEIIGLTQLKELYLVSNGLSNLSSSIGVMTSLEKLDLSVNEMVTLPQEIAYLTNLQFLSLHNNQLISLPSGIGDITNLEDLEIYHNELTTLPPEIGNLMKLKELNLHNNTIWTLPPEVSGLISLEKLNYTYNQLTSLSPNIGNIPNLKELRLEYNDLISLPPEIGNLNTLKYLYLDRNKLTTIPTQISGLSNLLYLYLSNNQLTYLPAGIGGLISLTHMELHSNQLYSLPTEIGDLISLYTLYVSNNNLTELPNTIGNLSKLQYLYAYTNQLSTLPPEVGNLGKLEDLHLSSNQITSLPPEIGNLGDLHVLNLSSNQLTSLPPEIGNLSDLMEISLSNNQFNSIPPELGHLKMLKKLYFIGNNASGCFDPQLIELCSQLYYGSYSDDDTYINTNNNFPNMWSTFCATGAGVCPINCRQTDSLALIAIRNATTLNTWDTGWNIYQPIDTWHGVTVNVLGCVIGLDLSNNGIEGQIAPEIGDLMYLKDLDLSGNYLDGSIPPEIGNLQDLETLNLSQNDLVGNLPIEISYLSELHELDLSSNWFVNDIPTSFISLEAELERLDLSYNLLTGDISTELSDIRTLRYLSLSGNMLTGEIPYSLGNISQLRDLYLDDNLLSGQIPYTLANLHQLRRLKLRNNALEGCYFTGLHALCERLSSSSNFLISDGNSFPEPWEDFCNRNENACEPVRPGDFNYDGIANEEDVLSWALSYEFSGPPRQGTPTNIDWRDHDAHEWQQTTLEKNSKHQDGDGDGTVNDYDLQVLDLNFGKTHNLGTPLNVNANTEYEFVRVDAGGSGTFRYQLHVRGENGEDVDLHGVSLTFNMGNLTSYQLTIDTLGSSLDPDIMYLRYDEEENKWHLALTRTDKVDKTCIGPVAEVDIVITENIPTGDPTQIMSIENGAQMTTNGLLEGLDGLTIYDAVQGFGSNQPIIGANVTHYDCDTRGEIVLEVTGGSGGYSYNWTTGATTSTIDDLLPGIYRATVTDSDNVSSMITVEVENKYLPVYDGEGNLIDCNTTSSSIAPQICVNLEGAYNTLTGMMRTDLQNKDILPQRQPYTAEPWYYSGLEDLSSVESAYPDSTAVDWVLVSFRTGTSADTEVGKAAAMLINDGCLYFPNGDVRLTGTASAVYVVVEHRNHMAVMTPTAVPITDRAITYDFRLSNSYTANGNGTGQKEMPDGAWVMLAGDCSQVVDIVSYDINGQDKAPWEEYNGNFLLYVPGDMNLDADINGQDKIFWFENNGISSRVPK